MRQILTEMTDQALLRYQRSPDDFVRVVRKLCTAGMSEPVLAVIRAEQYITSHPTHDLSLANVAREVGTNIYSLSRYFRKETGLHFVDYVCRVRVECAMSLIAENPSERIKAIFSESGFTSETHFNRVFLEWARETPSEFRKEYLKGYREQRSVKPATQ